MVFASWKKTPHNDSLMIEHNGQFIPYRKLLNLDPYDWWLVVSLDLVRCRLYRGLTQNGRVPFIFNALNKHVHVIFLTLGGLAHIE